MSLLLFFKVCVWIMFPSWEKLFNIIAIINAISF